MNLHLSLKKACVSDLYNAYSVIVKVAEMESYMMSIGVNIENLSVLCAGLLNQCKIHCCFSLWTRYVNFFFTARTTSQFLKNFPSLPSLLASKNKLVNTAICSTSYFWTKSFGELSLTESEGIKSVTTCMGQTLLMWNEGRGQDLSVNIRVQNIHAKCRLVHLLFLLWGVGGNPFGMRVFLSNPMLKCGAPTQNA